MSNKKKNYRKPTLKAMNKAGVEDAVLVDENKESKVKGWVEDVAGAWQNLSEEEKQKIKDKVIGGTQEIIKLKKEGKLTGQTMFNYGLGIAIAFSIFWSSFTGVSHNDLVEAADGLHEEIAVVDSTLDDYIKSDTVKIIIDDNGNATIGNSN